MSVAHLDDGERALVLGLRLEEVLSWVRTLSGTSELRALVVFDEVFGFLPPPPANPPTERPLLALLEQARAFGVGVVVATQNPMGLDYRALGNAGLWCVGRLQTDADRARVVEGLADAGPDDAHGAAARGTRGRGLTRAEGQRTARSWRGGPHGDKNAPRAEGQRTARSWRGGPHGDKRPPPPQRTSARSAGV